MNTERARERKTEKKNDGGGSFLLIYFICSHIPSPGIPRIWRYSFFFGKKKGERKKANRKRDTAAIDTDAYTGKVSRDFPLRGALVAPHLFTMEQIYSRNCEKQKRSSASRNEIKRLHLPRCGKERNSVARRRCLPGEPVSHWTSHFFGVFHFQMPRVKCTIVTRLSGLVN